MSQSPDEPRNVVDSEVFAVRRARRAEVSEDASLELRLFDAERLVATMAAERDALRARLDDRERELRAARQQAWAEQQQRLEAQGETAATRELAGGQVVDLRARLAAAESELAHVTVERDRVRDAFERELVEAALDRQRREAAERREAELRVQLERQAGLVAEAVQTVTAARRALETGRLRDGDAAVLERRLTAERESFAARVGQLEGAITLVGSQVGAAAGHLIARLEAERSAHAVTRTALAGRVEAERRLRQALDGLRAELVDVRAADAAQRAELSARLESVLATAEALGDGVRRELEAERAARRAAESRLAELEAEVRDLRAVARPVAADPAALAGLRKALATLAIAPAVPDPTVTADLSAAAARLRAASRDETSDPEPEPEPEPQPEPRRPLPRRAPVERSGPWLRDALLAMAAADPQRARQLLVALLPAQAGLVRRAVTYDVAIRGASTHRVVLTDEAAYLQDCDDIRPDASVEGTLAELVPLAAGAAARRLPGVQMRGRRRLRGVLRARRAPVGLPELAAAGITLPPGPLLAALAHAVDPAWMGGRALSVDVVGDDGATWRVVATGQGPLTVGPPDDASPAATLHASATVLPAVLAGRGPEQGVEISGDTDAVMTLLSWLDRAQRAAG